MPQTRRGDLETRHFFFPCKGVVREGKTRKKENDMKWTNYVLVPLAVLGGVVVYKGFYDSNDRTPSIVIEQRLKEHIRQDRTWTPENRAHHLVEYCQAQLEELNRYSKELEARAHEKSCAIASVKRELGSSDSSLNHYKRFLSEAKVKYREGEVQNKWPVMIGGYSLSRDVLQEKIIDTAEKIAEAEHKIGNKRNQLVSLEKTLQITQNEQRRIVKVREQIQNTINDLKIKKVIDADDGIVASLNAIEDSMGVLGVNYDDPKIESIVQPDKKTTREELFKQIMAE